MSLCTLYQNNCLWITVKNNMYIIYSKRNETYIIYHRERKSPACSLTYKGKRLCPQQYIKKDLTTLVTLVKTFYFSILYFIICNIKVSKLAVHFSDHLTGSKNLLMNDWSQIIFLIKNFFQLLLTFQILQKFHFLNQFSVSKVNQISLKIVLLFQYTYSMTSRIKIPFLFPSNLQNFI